MTMEIFDLIVTERARYPNLNTYSYVSKALNIKSRLEFILILKNLSKFVKSSRINASIAPDHITVPLCLSGTRILEVQLAVPKFIRELGRVSKF